MHHIKASEKYEKSSDESKSKILKIDEMTETFKKV